MGSGLTVTQLICAPRSRKYSVAVVPTGSFCRTSSSFRDLPSAERQATQLRSYPGLCPLPPGCPGVVKQQLYSLGSRRRDWRAGYHCGSAGRAGRHSTQPGGAQGPHSSSNQEQGLCGSRTQSGRALAEAGWCPSENQARAFLPVATRGRCNRQAQKVLGSTMGISAGPRGRDCQEGSHPEAPAQRGCRRQCGWALDLRLLVKRFLISAMVAWGST